MLGSLSTIVNAASLLFCVTGVAIVLSIILEAYIGWYSGVEYGSSSLVSFWGMAFAKAVVVSGAVCLVAHSLWTS